MLHDVVGHDAKELFLVAGSRSSQFAVYDEQGANVNPTTGVQRHANIAPEVWRPRNEVERVEARIFGQVEHLKARYSTVQRW
jgi:hypothetical protein